MMKNKVLAVFDFDGTITTKDTLLEFIQFVFGRNKLYFAFVLYSPLLIAMKLKVYPNYKAKQKILSYFFKGMGYQEFKRYGKDFAKEIDKMVRPLALDRINKYKNQGVATYVVSASVCDWVAPWCSENNIDVVLGTRLEVNKEGKLTGRLSTRNCYGVEKVNQLKEVLGDLSSYEIHGYGDSSGDKELLEISAYSEYKPFRTK